MRGKQKTIVLLAAATLTAAVGFVTQHASAAEPESTAARIPLRVMNWNIHGGVGRDGVYDFSRIADEIRRQNPDIVTLQEVHHEEGQTPQWELLENEFPGYESHFARGDDITPGSGSAGNLIFSRYPILERLTHKLPNDDSGAVDRSLGGARVQIEGTDVRVYTTHLSSGAGAAAVARRRAQAQDAINTMPASLMTSPMVFTGDLNVRPDDEIRFWFANARWVDAWTQLHPNIGSDVVTYPGGDDDARIDYAYGTPVLDVMSAHRVVTTASDHYPVVTDFEIPITRVSKAGVVLAGADQRAGWAHAGRYPNGAATLWVCDNNADGWGVRGYVHDKASGRLVATIADGAYADRCNRVTNASAALGSSFIVKTCLYQAGVTKDCRQREV